MSDDDLEVVWNGAHCGCDADLLCTEAQSEKFEPTTDLELISIREKVTALLATSRAGALTHRQLVAWLGGHGQAIHRALHYLRMKGILQSEDINPGVARRVRAPQYYWKRA